MKTNLEVNMYLKKILLVAIPMLILKTVVTNSSYADEPVFIRHGVDASMSFIESSDQKNQATSIGIALETRQVIEDVSSATKIVEVDADFKVIAKEESALPEVNNTDESSVEVSTDFSLRSLDLVDTRLGSAYTGYDISGYLAIPLAESDQNKQENFGINLALETGLVWQGKGSDYLTLGFCVRPRIDTTDYTDGIENDIDYGLKFSAFCELSPHLDLFTTAEVYQSISENEDVMVDARAGIKVESLTLYASINNDHRFNGTEEDDYQLKLGISGAVGRKKHRSY
jgi:hypothetical protein